jgi:ceramide glucosyltransferase
MSLIHPILTSVGFVSLALATGYAVVAAVAVLAWRLRTAATKPRLLPPVTVLKPLCGAEPGLYEHLRSFCLQDYPAYQIVFGIRDPADPAVSVVERLAAEFPSLPIDIVINSQQHGSNLKVSNLINMIGRARHETLVLADSDTYVGPDYLAAVTAPLLDARVGLVTCLYRAMPTRTIWSRLGAMYMNEWYVPSVLLTWLFGYEGYVSGQTICLRRATLHSVGGLPALANHLADDYLLGALVRGLGLRVVLSPYVVEGEHHEPNFGALAQHELRWLRTIRVLRPRSFCLLFLTFSLPLAALGLVLAAAEPSLAAPAWALFGVTLIARLIVHFVHRLAATRSLFVDLWLLVFRDLLICAVWCQSFRTFRVTWRGSEFNVDADGIMRRVS